MFIAVQHEAFIFFCSFNNLDIGFFGIFSLKHINNNETGTKSDNMFGSSEPGCQKNWSTYKRLALLLRVLNFFYKPIIPKLICFFFTFPIEHLSLEKRSQFTGHFRHYPHKIKIAGNLRWSVKLLQFVIIFQILKNRYRYFCISTLKLNKAVMLAIQKFSRSL